MYGWQLMIQAIFYDIDGRIAGAKGKCPPIGATTYRKVILNLSLVMPRQNDFENIWL